MEILDSLTKQLTAKNHIGLMFVLVSENGNCTKKPGLCFHKVTRGKVFTM